MSKTNDTSRPATQHELRDDELEKVSGGIEDDQSVVEFDIQCLRTSKPFAVPFTYPDHT